MFLSSDLLYNDYSLVTDADIYGVRYLKFGLIPVIYRTSDKTLMYI